LFKSGFEIVSKQLNGDIMKNRKLIISQMSQGRSDLAITNLIVGNWKTISVKLMVKWIRWIDPQENPYNAIRSIVGDTYYWTTEM